MYLACSLATLDPLGLHVFQIECHQTQEINSKPFDPLLFETIPIY